MRKAIIGYLTGNASATCSEIAEILGLKASRTREYLSKMIKEGVLESNPISSTIKKDARKARLFFAEIVAKVLFNV